MSVLLASLVSSFALWGVVILVIVGSVIYESRETPEGLLYDKKNRNRYPCAFCGQTRQTTHPIYHSVFKMEKQWLAKRTVVVYEYGFALCTCDRCLSKQRGWVVFYFSVAALLCFGGLLAVVALSALNMGALGCLVVLLASVTAGFCFIKYARNRAFPWQDLALLHPKIEALHSRGCTLDRAYPRYVREGLDTKNRRDEYSRRKKYAYDSDGHALTYEWGGILEITGRSCENLGDAASLL